MWRVQTRCLKKLALWRYVTACHWSSHLLRIVHHQQKVSLWMTLKVCIMICIWNFENKHHLVLHLFLHLYLTFLIYYSTLLDFLSIMWENLTCCICVRNVPPNWDQISCPGLLWLITFIEVNFLRSFKTLHEWKKWFVQFIIILHTSFAFTNHQIPHNLVSSMEILVHLTWMLYQLLLLFHVH